jgi:hypothetical protein
LASANLKLQEQVIQSLLAGRTFVVMPTGVENLFAISYQLLTKEERQLLFLLHCFNENQVDAIRVCLQRWYCACVDSSLTKTDYSGKKKTLPLVDKTFVCSAEIIQREMFSFLKT